MPALRLFVSAAALIASTTSGPLVADVSVTSAPLQVAASEGTEVGDAVVAMLPADRHVVVWRTREPEEGRQRVFFRIFDAAGVGEAANEVTTDLVPVDTNPTVAANAAGTFLIAWNGEGTPWLRAYDAAGTSLGPPLGLDPEEPEIAGETRVLAMGEGFLVLWNRWPGGHDQTWGRFIGPNGQATTDPALVTSAGGVWGGAFGADPWLAIIGEDAGGLATLWATRAVNGVLDGELHVVATASGGFLGETCGVVGVGDGGALFFWSQFSDSGGDVVQARRLAADGEPLGPAATVNESSDASYVHAAAVPGGAVAVWQESGPRRLVAQAFDEDGVAQGAAQAVAQQAPGDWTFRPRVDFSADAGVVVWERQRSATSEYAVFTRRLTTRCSAGNRLCLGSGGRFEVAVDWRTQQGEVGHGTALQLTGDSGAIWFFGATNLELMVKVIDACSFNNRYWVFVAGLTDVQVTLTVTDTATGAVRTYVNPLKQAFQPIQDTSAFATCP